MNYLGIDIGGTAVKIGIVTEKGEVLVNDDYSVSFDDYTTPIIKTVLESTDIFMEKKGFSIDDMGGIGISATGQIDTESGIVVGTAGHIKNWVDTPIKKLFTQKYQKKVHVINDANCVALGEQWTGNARGCKNAIIITIGTGVGGGIIVDDKILNGQIGIAGELGHFSINNKGIPCSCGNLGCYEQYASMSALIRMVRLKYKFPPVNSGKLCNADDQNLSPMNDGNSYHMNSRKTYDTTLDGSTGTDYYNLENITGKKIFEQLLQGDILIGEIVNEWVTNVVTGLINLTHIFNPEIILIGGGVSTQEELFVSKVRSQVLAGVMPRFGQNLKVEPAALGNLAGIVGAVKYLAK